jgi:uncharacterized membrane protein
MNLKKFIIPAVTLVVGAAAGVVYGVKNADGIKDAIKAGKEAADEKVKQLREAAEEAKKKVTEASEDVKKEAEEVAGKVAEAAAEIVDIGEKQPQQPREQPRGKDGKFVKA